jgi:hypothetical protein
MKYVKMVIPKIGTFTNGNYDIKGVMLLGRLIGYCTYSRYDYVMCVGEYKNLPKYHLKNDLKSQFIKKNKIQGGNNE